MHGLIAKSSVSPLNIFGLLMRCLSSLALISKFTWKSLFRILNLKLFLLENCPSRIEVTGFDGNENGFYAYQPQGFYRQESGPNCIGRSHAPDLHWWLRSCSGLGENGGIAYIGRQHQCPTDGKQGSWRQGGTDSVLNGYATIANLGNQLWSKNQ